MSVQSSLHRQSAPPSQPELRRAKNPRRFERSLNGTGYTIHELDEVSRAFVAFAAENAPDPVLDIGAGFGVATLAALAGGARVIANDVEAGHLEEIRRRVPAAAAERLTLCAGRFPDDLELPVAGVSGVLLSRVLHFFSGPAIEQAAQRLADWLRPGGKVYMVCEASLFLGEPRLRRRYEQQLAEGHAWPGFVTGVHALLPERTEFVPDQLHYLEPERLARVFEVRGFAIERADVFRRGVGEEFPRRECVAVIARRT